MSNKAGIRKTVSTLRRSLLTLIVTTTASVAGVQQGIDLPIPLERKSEAWPAEINPAAEIVNPDGSLWMFQKPSVQAIAGEPDPVVVTPTSLEFSVPQQGSDSQVLEITNQGTADVEWSFEAVSLAGYQPWASRFESAGPFNEAYDIRVSPDGSRVFTHGLITDPSFIGLYGTVAYDAVSGAELWSVTQVGFGNNGFALGRGMDISPDGQAVYVTGMANVEGFSHTDFMTVAYDAATGDEVWRAFFNWPGASDGFDDRAGAVRVSPDGSRVFVAGDSVDAASGRDIAVVAYDAAAGDELWDARYSGPGGNDELALGALEVSPDGSRVYVTGESLGDGTGLDYATVAFDTDTGNQLWASRYDGPVSGNDIPHSLVAGADGARVFVTGWSLNTEGDDDYATVAYDAVTGQELWIARLDGPANGFDRAFAVTASLAGDSVYVTGTTTGNDGRELTTIAYDAGSGAELWQTSYREPDSDFVTGWTIGVHPDGSQVYVAGSYSAGTGNWLAAAYDATTGAILWLEPYAQDALGSGGNTARALAVAPDGSRVFITGEIEREYATVAFETGLGGEACIHPEDIPWLAADPDTGTTPPASTTPVDVSVDAAGLDSGEYTALLCLDSNGSAAPFVEIPVSLIVLEPGVLVTDPGKLEFAAVGIGHSETASVTVANAADLGADDLELSTFTLSGDPAFERVGGDCQESTVLAPQHGCTIDVRFTPSDTAMAAGTLEVQTLAGQTATVELSGSGVDLEDSIFRDRFEE